MKQLNINDMLVNKIETVTFYSSTLGTYAIQSCVHDGLVVKEIYRL